MGRVAGPLTKHRYAAIWKQEVAARRLRAEKRRHIPPEPLVAPPAARRRMALVWFIAEAFDGEIAIGHMYQPPMTPDMRWLVQRGYLRSVRPLLSSDSRRTRKNMLVLTDLGRATLAGRHLNSEDMRWIEAAYAHNMLT